MEKQIQFVATSPQDLKNEIITEVKVILDDFLKHYKPVRSTEYLSRKQVAELFGVNISTVHHWTRSGQLKSFGIGSRVFYLRSDIEAALIPLNE